MMPLGVRSLQARVLLLTTGLLLLVLGALVLLLQIQDRLDQDTRSLRETLLPAARILEQGYTELQIAQNQIRVLSQSGALQSPQAAATLAIPSVFKDWIDNTKLERPELDLRAWRDSAKAYAAATENLQDPSLVEQKLQVFLDQTAWLDRTADRQVALRLLKLSESNRQHVLLLSGGVLLALVGAILFLFLVWKWMSPVESMRRWLVDATRDPLKAPPVKQNVTSFWGAPQEIEDLTVALRAHLDLVRCQSRELEERRSKVVENERALQILFTALQYYIRHSEVLGEELLKKERLASMGHMAAELAHEIRNPLNAMSLKLEMLKEDVAGSQFSVHVDMLLAELDRLDALTESHLRTTRQTLLIPQTTVSGTSVDQTIHELCDLLQPEAKKAGLALSVSLAPEETWVALPKNVLKAALLNLMKNGLEAQKEQGHGELRLELDEGTKEFRLRLLDRGPGFSPERLANPFQPFVSTKPGGSGLGLATTQKMLEPYGIKIRLLESPPEGWGAAVELVSMTVSSKNLTPDERVKESSL